MDANSTDGSQKSCPVHTYRLRMYSITQTQEALRLRLDIAQRASKLSTTTSLLLCTRLSTLPGAYSVEECDMFDDRDHPDLIKVNVDD